MRALAGAPTLRVAIQESLGAAGLRALGDLNRGDGEIVESELATRLDADKQAEIEAEAVDFLGGEVPGLGTIEAIEWSWLGGGRKPADFYVNVAASERSVALPLNVKRTTERIHENWNAAVSTNTLLRVACGLPIVSPKKLTRIPTGKTLLEFAAGARTLEPGDYFILDIIASADNELKSVEAQGLLSHVVEENGALVLSFKRQHGRPGDLIYRRATAILPDDFDVNAAFIDAMLPAPLAAEELALLTIAQRRANGEALASLRASAREALR
jgi:hypothetical protein